MLHLYGCPITPEDARDLVATLLADGSPDALSAAAAITKGVDRELYAIALEPFQRDAILACLEDPPDELAASTRAQATQKLAGPTTHRASQGGTKVRALGSTRLLM